MQRNDAMTAAQLIERLQKLPPDTKMVTVKLDHHNTTQMAYAGALVYKPALEEAGIVEYFKAALGDSVEIK